MNNANIEVANALNAWKAGENAALDNLQVGNVFLGAMNIAAALGYADDTLEHSMAMGGAVRMIRKFQIFTDNDHVIVELIEE